MKNPTFLNEPASRWFFFVGFIIVLLIVWSDLLRFMRKAGEAVAS